MFDKRIRFHSSEGIDLLAKVLVSAAVICLLAPISFKFTDELSTTLQTLVILVCACAFGMKVGFLSALLYIAVGTLGIPVFSDYTSGLDTVLGAHGGFFFGFLAAAAVAGFLSEKSGPRKFPQNLGIWILAHIIILALGFGWLKNVRGDIKIWDTLYPLLPGLFMKIAMGILVLHIIGRFVDRKEKAQASS